MTTRRRVSRCFLMLTLSTLGCAVAPPMPDPPPEHPASPHAEAAPVAERLTILDDAMPGSPVEPPTPMPMPMPKDDNPNRPHHHRQRDGR